MPRKIRAVLVEDQPSDAKLILHQLRSNDYDVEARVVDNQVDFVEALGAHPDVILADYNVPGFDAFATLDCLKSTGRDVPLIVVSGTIGEDVAVAAIRAGAHDYVLKDRLGRLGAAVSHALEERRLEQLERERNARYRTILDALSELGEGLVITEAGKLVYANQAYTALTGYTEDELKLKGTLVELAPEALRPELYARLRERLEGDKAESFIESQLVTKAGRVVDVESAIHMLPSERSGAILAIVRDITERKQLQQALEYQSLHDALTGLPNRVLLGDRVQQAIAHASRHERQFGLLLLDLDRFKDVNDTLGHQQGDVLLIQFAQRLREEFRESDTVARLGGDEFAILPDGIETEEALMGVAGKILRMAEEPFVLNARVVDAALSIGIAIFPMHGDDIGTLVRHADVAMYTAKRRGLGCAVYTPDQDEHTEKRLTLLSQLRRGIRRDALVLHYQPQLDLKTGQVRALEALVRWHHPTQGLLMPDQFLPMAEQSELMAPLTAWVLDEALRQLKTWQRMGYDLVVSVNVTSRNLQDPSFATTVAQLLNKHRVDPSRLTLEITESSAMSPLAIEGLKPLHATGVTLAIDDFGTGYSSLAYLKRLPVGEIKIDKSFIMELATDEDDAAIVRPTITLGHNLELKVVAEGLETEAAHRLLIEYGCDYAQGHFISPPIGAEATSSWLATTTWEVPRLSSRLAG